MQIKDLPKYSDFELIEKIQEILISDSDVIDDWYLKEIEGKITIVRETPRMFEFGEGITGIKKHQIARKLLKFYAIRALIQENFED